MMSAMHRIGLLLLMCQIYMTPTFAQCPSSINAATQQQLEFSMSQFPDCEHISGNVTISGSVHDLSVLSNVKSIGGTLTIIDNTMLTSLAGLGSLTAVGGLTIDGNSMLLSPQGLNQLQTIGGSLTIRDCPSLTSLEGLQNVTLVNGTMHLTALAALTTLSGLNGLMSISENLQIVGMAALQSLDGLQNLQRVEKDIVVGGSTSIEFAPELMSVSGLSGLQEVGGVFTIYHCTKLQVIDGINNLISARSMNIHDNAALTHINDFEALITVGDALNSGGLNIDDNPVLTQIDGTRALRSADALRISGELIEHIALDNLEAVDGRLYLYAPSLHTMPGMARLASVAGDMTLTTGASELPDFPILESIGGFLFIDSPDSLEAITGFNSLQSIGIGPGGWGFDIFEHDKLTSITGFQNLRTVEGDFVLASNDKLVSIQGLRSLQSVGGDFRVAGNTILNDCSPLCSFLSEGTVGEDININFNGHPSGGCRTLQTLLDRCSYDMVVVDANPNFFPPELSGYNNITELNVEDLLLLTEERDAVTADGVSKVLLKLEMPVPGNIVSALPVDAVTFPWGTMTFSINEKNYCYALYQPPSVFNPSQGSTFQYRDEVLGMDQFLSFDFADEENTHTLLDFSITLVRPPLILIHGTYSSPDKWKAAAEGGQSMYDVLTGADYKAFLLDYINQNGSDNSVECAFNDLVNVLRDNPGGINASLEYYRENLNAAVTQVDVIGHSLGGLIPRIYASDHYNPGGYARRENFMEGDLNRIITIGSTHFGSHLAEFQHFMENGISPFNVGPLEWIQAATLTYLTASWLGAPLSGAVRDQLPAPMGEALQNLGATPIPSHAVALSVPRGSLKSAQYDPHEEYYDMFWYITLLMQMNEGILEQYLDYKLSLADMGLQAATTLDGGDPKALFPKYQELMLLKSMIEDGVQLSGRVLSVMDGEFEIPSEAVILNWVMAETGMSDIIEIDPLISIFLDGANSAGVVQDYISSKLTPDAQSILENYLSVHDQSMEALRFLIFNNDDNDGVVRVQSQTGELEKYSGEYVSRFENHLHGPALTYPDLQSRVLQLLDSGFEHFRIDGFPAPDHSQLLYYPSEVVGLYQLPRVSGDAICQSGMVPEHARAFARVADRENVIIIVRPVNPAATALISCGAATKGMDVKPKSSDWGPQNGYLPVEQRYSKLWNAFEGEKRDEAIAYYNLKAQENLTDGITVSRHLQVEACSGFYWVFIDSTQLLDQGDLSAENEIVLVPVSEPDQVCYYGTHFATDMNITDCEPRFHDRYGPFQVMATPDVLESDNVTPKYLTADYDILSFGFYRGEDNPHDPPENIEFKEGVGQITPAQEDLLEKLNDAVQATGYQGGNVAHHGPENQFKWSPYIDYPLTVFMPDDIPNGFITAGSQGQILSIDMGPLGFRDIALKQFVNRMRMQGYDLYTNVDAPGWQWTWDAGREGYLLEDAPDLPPYVEQLPLRKCDKSGYRPARVCGPDCRPGTPLEKPKPVSWFSQRSSPAQDFTISPNPIMIDALNVNVSCAEAGEYQFSITDAFGSIRMSRTFPLTQGDHTLSLSVRDLEPGIYAVQSEGYVSLRFVRL